MMIGTEPLTESFVTAENEFSSGQKITDCQEELVSFTKDILSAIWKDIGPNLKQLVLLAKIGYNKSLLDRCDLYYNIINKRKGAGKG